MTAELLVVDDEPSLRKVLAAQLGRAGYSIRLAASAEEALDCLEASPVDVLITDLRMPGMDGLGLLDWAKVHAPTMPVILLTAYGTVDSAVEALKRGAFDYITKPFDQRDLLAAVEKAAASADRARDLVTGNTPADAVLLGESPAMRAAWEVIDRVAPSPASVLVTGEPGTGKDLVARALHDRSRRSKGPFIQVHCGAVPDRLFEEELFGRESNHMPGSAPAKPGRFELADGGTLFLDEVDALPRDMQVKVLQVLRGEPFERVGGNMPVRVDVRVVAASDSDLARTVREGSFREDLFYRLNVIPIRLVPLRERPDDLPGLVQHLLYRLGERLGARKSRLDEEAIALLQRHSWPGNLRELENVLERAVLLASDQVVGAQDLVGFEAEEDLLATDLREHQDLDLKTYLKLHTERLERHRIRHALQIEEGNVTRAARRLGISRRSLQTKMKDYGLRDR